LEREVINPQNGHILGYPPSPRRDFAVKNFPKESARKVRKVRRWTRKGCKTEPALSRIDRFRMTYRWLRFWARLLKLHEIGQFAMLPVNRSGCWGQKQSEQFRPAILSVL